MIFFNKKPIRKVSDAIWIIYFVNKFISISPYEYAEHGHKLTLSGTIKCLITFILYSITFYLVLQLFSRSEYRKYISLVSLVGNMVEAIVGVDAMVMLFIFSVIQSKEKISTWEALEKIDNKFHNIGISLTYNKFMSFSLRIAIMTLGSLAFLQWNRSYIEAQSNGILGFIYGMHNIMPLVVTFAIILQFQCILYLFDERITFINNYLEQIIQAADITRQPHTRALFAQNRAKISDRNSKNKTVRCEHEILRRYLHSKAKYNSPSKTCAILNILSELGEWVENIKESYSVPVLVSLNLLAITSVFRLYLGIWHFNKIQVWDFLAYNAYFTTTSIQLVINGSILVLLFLVESCGRKVNLLSLFIILSIKMFFLLNLRSIKQLY